MTFDQAEELLVIVDPHDHPLGAERRGVIHRRGLLHRSAHILVFNGAGELLIQKRGAHKDTYPHCWDVSAGGHVGPGESYDQAAHRELEEELGLSGELQFFRKTGAGAESGWEFTCLYTLTTDQPPHPNPHEIEGWKFCVPRTLLGEIRAGGRRATPVLERDLALYLGEEEAARVRSAVSE